MSAVTAVSCDVDTSDIDVDLPDGFQVQIDLRCARGEDLRHLVGGSPTRMLTLTDPALGMTSADGRITVCDSMTRSLARRLLDTGIGHPRPMFGPRVEDVTVVIPVRDDQEGVDRLLAALTGVKVVVVDDGSAEPVRASAPGVRLLRLDGVGTAAARNAGAAVVDTEIVGFVDAGCVPSGEWLTMLLGHFSDPAVAVVAPRITGIRARRRGRSVAERYENGYSLLDMGPAESAVVPGTAVPFVSAAAMLVRRKAFDTFDTSGSAASDIDLCWRLHEAGWRLRYDPVAEVARDHRTDLRAVLDRRRHWGSSAALLADRHPGFPGPAVASVPTAIAAVALLTRTRIGVIIAMLVLGQRAIHLSRLLDGLPAAPSTAIDMTGRALGSSVLAVGGAACRQYWPVAVVAALFSARFRALLIELAVVEALASWLRRAAADPSAPAALGPVTYVVMRRLDDLAYGAGLWAAVVENRDLRPLKPLLAMR